jgi:hypothetical protein
MACIDVKHVVTRKAHKCYGCERTFEAGSRLQVVTTVDRSEISDTYWCAVCEAYWTEQGYHEEDAGSPGDVKAADPSYWEELRVRIEGVTPEVRIDTLARLYEATKGLIRMIPDNQLPDYQAALDELEEVESTVLHILKREGKEVGK